MPLELPAYPAGWSKPPVPNGRRFQIELITPLFGGGVEPGANDESFPIRPTSIRGQLQFWWRATAGARCDSKQELRKRQSEVWGSTERASPVEVRVVEVDASDAEPCAEFEKDRNNPKLYRSTPTWHEPFKGYLPYLPYALFPFQGQPDEKREHIKKDPASCIHRAKFQLEIRCPDDLRSEVEEAIRVWILFGGLGSRTRRGCGAIRCEKFDPKDRNGLISVLQAFLREPSPVRDWPTLAGAILVGPEKEEANEAWAAAVALLRDFRQGVGIGRNEGEDPRRPGRSRWPEPDTIRRLTGQWLPRHRPDDKMPDGFPRAELGLPIVFHFKDRGDPSDIIVRYPAPAADGTKRDRMASPLILKPVALANGKAIPLILRLKTLDLGEVDLRRKVEDQEQSLALRNAEQIRGAAFAGYRNSPLARSPNGSALEAFLQYAVSNGFEEVKA